jgi:hypothetical protein
MVVEWIDHLEVDTKEALPKLGTLIVNDIKSDVAQGRKGNESPMPDLSTRYEVQKLKEGHSPLPDLHRSGLLMSQLRVLALGIAKSGKDWLDIGFMLTGAFGGFGGGKGSPNDIKKWRTLKKQGRDPLKISRRDLKRFAKQFVKEGLLKEVPGPPKKGA